METTSMAPGLPGPDDRIRRIRELAYLLAERGGFVPGKDTECWLAAEREIDLRTARERRENDTRSPRAKEPNMPRARVLAVAVNNFAADVLNANPDAVQAAENFILNALPRFGLQDLEVRSLFNADATPENLNFELGRLGDFGQGDVVFLFLALPTFNDGAERVVLSRAADRIAVPYDRAQIDNVIAFLRSRGVDVQVQERARAFVVAPAPAAPLGKSVSVGGSDPALEKIFQQLSWQSNFFPRIAEDLSAIRRLQERAAQFRLPLPATPGAKAIELDAATDKKFFGDVLGILAQVLPKIVPVVADAVANRTKALDISSTSVQEADQKFLGGLVASLLTSVVPVVISRVTGQGKSLEVSADGNAVNEADQKYFGALLRVIGDILPVVVPAVVDAVNGRAKALVPSQEADRKFLGGLAASILMNVVPRILPLITGQGKALGSEADQKGLLDVFRVIAQVLPAVVPVVTDAILSRTKELELEGTQPQMADQKFFGALIGMAVSGLVPHVISAITGQGKALELGVDATASETADKGLFNVVLGVLGDVLPVVIPAVVDAVGQRNKGFDVSEGPVSGADQKFLGALLGIVPGIIGGVLGRL